MRHRKAGRALGRSMSHRKATLQNLAISLFTHNAVKTTVAKSKELRSYAEPLITLARTDTVANRRLAFAKLRNNTVVKKLFTEIAPTYKERPGGYTRILKLDHRLGDGAQLARIELVGLGEYKAEE
ncbi:MAG TPA: 50S ribosomal protein L17 [Candidatus Hydrogenedentes bacterium]|nr:50S ribosomal protein L17 [Candidatus Hydrogenedentota bacterium]HRK35380.1 50S ribosomal protein L17 [Candidatus Hydrogenedentota bacterium]